MTGKELSDNLTFLSALGLLERLREQGLLTMKETEKIWWRPNWRLHPTLLLA